MLRTALQLFTEQGYFNTSVHDIARTAKVSIGSIYHYFNPDFPLGPYAEENVGAKRTGRE